MVMDAHFHYEFIMLGTTDCPEFIGFGALGLWPYCPRGFAQQTRNVAWRLHWAFAV